MIYQHKTALEDMYRLILVSDNEGDEPETLFELKVRLRTILESALGDKQTEKIQRWIISELSILNL